MNSNLYCQYRACSANLLDYTLNFKQQSPFITCQFCTDAKYCSQSCLEMDWGLHQIQCPALKNSDHLASSSSTYRSNSKASRKNSSQQFIIPIPLRDFKVLDQEKGLGQGGQGTVILVQEKKTNKYFAMKKINKQQLFKYSTVENLKKEIKIHRKIDHPHIIKLYGYFEDKENVSLILEYAEKGNLFHYLKRKKKLTENQVFVFFYQVCLAIDYLHNRNIIHRDLKPENILLDSHGNAKICDFGWSTEYKKQAKNSFCGTIEYMAPEVVKNLNQTTKVDIWCLGILLYELLHGKPPFTGKNDNEKCKKILASSGETLEYDSSLSMEVKTLMKILINPNPSKRPSVSVIFQSQWMQIMQKRFGLNLEDYLWDINHKERKASLSVSTNRSQPENFQSQQLITPRKIEVSKAINQRMSIKNDCIDNEYKKRNEQVELRQKIEEKRKKQEIVQDQPRQERRRGQQDEQDGFFKRFLCAMGCIQRDQRRSVNN